MDTPPLVVSADERAAGTQIDGELAVDLPVNRHRELDVDVAVHGSSLEMRGIVVGHGNRNSTIGGAGIELAAFPAVSGKLNG